MLAGQTPDDQKLAAVLANMRLNQLTTEDIDFLRAKESNDLLPSTDAVAICAHRCIAEKINDLQIERFAAAAANSPAIVAFQSEDRVVKAKPRHDDADQACRIVPKAVVSGFAKAWADKACRLPRTLRLCVGAPVILVAAAGAHSDKLRTTTNGSRGFVERFGDNVVHAAPMTRPRCGR